MNKDNKALLSLFLVTFIWGCNFPISAYLLQNFSPIFLSTVRLCFTSLFLIIFAITLKGIRRPTLSEWKLLLGAGIFGTLINQTFFFTGLQQTSSANASLIIALTPIATIFLEWIVFKVKLEFKKMFGATISLIGVFSIIGISSGSFGVSWGDLNIVAAMLSLSISLLFIRALSKSMNSFIITIYATVLGTVLIIPAAGVEGFVSGTVMSKSLIIWILLITAAIIGQGFAGFMWNKAVGDVGPGTASMFMNIQPFIAILAAHFMLGDPILMRQILGGILVIFGVFIANISSNKQKLVIEPIKKSA